MTNNMSWLENLPDGCIVCITSFLTIGQLSNVGQTCRECHEHLWLHNPGGWKEIVARFNGLLTSVLDNETASRVLPNDIALARRVLQTATSLFQNMGRSIVLDARQNRHTSREDLESLLFDDAMKQSFRVFAYTQIHELKAAIINFTRRQCCGSGALHVIHGGAAAEANDDDLVDAVCVMDAALETAAGYSVTQHRDVYSYLAAWPPQVRESDLVVVLSGAFQVNKDLLQSIPEALRHRVIIAHRPDTAVSRDDSELVVASFPVVAVTQSFCQRPNFASPLGSDGTSREMYMDIVRFLAVECGKGSRHAETLVLVVLGGGTVNIRCTFLPYSRA